MRCAEDVSLRPSSELRLFSLSPSAPSVDLYSSSSWVSLLMDTVDDSGPFEVARLGARLSEFNGLRERSTAAMASFAFSARRGLGIL